MGRLPAASVAEARALADEIVAWESGGYGLVQPPAVPVADDADRPGDFEADSEAIAATLLAGRGLERVYLSRLRGATRQAIRAGFDRGAGIVSYAGHGGMVIWASENVFNIWDVPSLAPQPQQPLVLTMDCLNGYILSPSIDSLSEALLKAQARGAIAAFSPSGMSVQSAADRYQRLLLGELVSGRHERLGDALLRPSPATPTPARSRSCWRSTCCSETPR